MTKKYLKAFLIIISLVIFYIVITVTGYIYFAEKTPQIEDSDSPEEERYDWFADGCKGDKVCKKCKSDLRCLKCMDNCYNRHGSPDKAENPFQEKALSCNDSCWSDNRPKAATTDFYIKPFSGRK